MTLPLGFTFTQSNLQDFIDCPLRFYLRYILKLQWPSLVSEPIMAFEERMENGQRFHQLVHQYSLGLPANLLQDQLIDEPDLLKWWGNFHDHDPLQNLPANRISEIVLTLPYEDFRLNAVIDLLAWDQQGSYTIIDWKTASKRPNRKFLEARIQTDLYPFLVKRTIASTAPPLPADDLIINFIYWFPEFPTTPETFKYTQERDDRFSARLHDLIHTIARLEPHDFTMTSKKRLCQYCNYRSYCERGVQAGNFNDNMEDLNESFIDFDHVILDENQ
ncbi:MAG: PD-(D/E)XK nuclease family protein [Anaerolineae bacterium]|nr:PD-(D/E)XK nuclease family protein [Anaerolineae bacterium]